MRTLGLCLVAALSNVVISPLVSADSRPFDLGTNDLAVEPMYMAATTRGSEERFLFGDSPADYRGGRGLVTRQGMSGMFLNPTSGTLNQGQLTLQYCTYINDYNFGNNSFMTHGVLLDYGVFDWLNVGARYGNTHNHVPDAHQHLDNVGPFVRIRIIKDQGAWPEISMGLYYYDGGAGSDSLSKREAFLAASKLFDVDPDGFLRSVRVHLGARYACKTEAPVVDESYVYTGVEVEIPYDLYLIGELSTNNLETSDAGELPYALGVQWKPNNVLGLSLAHMNPRAAPSEGGLWFGVGLNFQF